MSLKLFQTRMLLRLYTTLNHILLLRYLLFQVVGEAQGRATSVSVGLTAAAVV